MLWKHLTKVVGNLLRDVVLVRVSQRALAERAPVELRRVPDVRVSVEDDVRVVLLVPVLGQPRAAPKREPREVRRVDHVVAQAEVRREDGVRGVPVRVRQRHQLVEPVARLRDPCRTPLVLGRVRVGVEGELVGAHHLGCLRPLQALAAGHRVRAERVVVEREDRADVRVLALLRQPHVVRARGRRRAFRVHRLLPLLVRVLRSEDADVVAQLHHPLVLGNAAERFVLVLARVERVQLVIAARPEDLGEAVLEQRHRAHKTVFCPPVADVAGDDEPIVLKRRELLHQFPRLWSITQRSEYKFRKVNEREEKSENMKKGEGRKEKEEKEEKEEKTDGEERRKEWERKEKRKKREEE